MILFSILVLTIILLTIITIVAIALGGTAFIIVFGDVIVCVFILIWIIKKIFFNNKK